MSTTTCFCVRPDNDCSKCHGVKEGKPIEFYHWKEKKEEPFDKIERFNRITKKVTSLLEEHFPREYPWTYKLAEDICDAFWEEMT